MPLMDAGGTSVDRISPDRVMKSMPPARNWLSMSVSEPSWLAGNTRISTAPLVSCAMRDAASCARTLSGWLGGRLEPNLKLNSAARPGRTPKAMAADAAARPRRVRSGMGSFPCASVRCVRKPGALLTAKS